MTINRLEFRNARVRNNHPTLTFAREKISNAALNDRELGHNVSTFFRGLERLVYYDMLHNKQAPKYVRELKNYYPNYALQTCVLNRKNSHNTVDSFHFE